MGKQKKLPGTEGETIKELDEAAEFYAEQATKSVKQRKTTAEARDSLVAAMKKHKREVYRDESMNPPLVVTLVPGVDKVRVTEGTGDDGDDSDGGETH